MRESNDQPWTLPHYRRNSDLVADYRTLSVYRQRAGERARRKGAEWACGLCYRPCKGKPAKLKVGHNSKTYQRQLCYGCFEVVKAFLAMEASKQRWDSQLSILEM